MSLLAVGRKYGVSDNAVRKWIRWYEYEQERNGNGNGNADGGDRLAGGEPA